MQEMVLIAASDSAANPMIIGLVVLILLLVVLVLAFRKKKPPAHVELDEKARPKKNVLEDRLEVDAPVEIHEGMSLAEIKRAKAARITGEKGKRETAVEATQKSRDDHATEAPAKDAGLDDVSAGWESMLDEDEPLLSTTSEASAPAPEPEVRPEPKVSKPIVSKGLDEGSVADEKATRLSDGLAKTRTGFISKLGELFKGEKLNENLVDEIEEVLFTADIGTSAANDILHAVQSQLNSDQKQDPKTVWAFVRQYVLEKLKAREEPLDLDRHHPFVILVVGVNGVGKTTTIGKLASKFKKQGKGVLMVAGDTFRAAAVEQLGVWGERTDIAVHQGEPDSDPSSVIYAGIERGVKEGVDIIICDTAGRLHTKVNLLDELRKMNRVASKVIASAPHETILVLDANTGQNAIQQAKLFSEAVDISGIVLTKLDGTAKGGVILGICEELNAPIRYIGIGESVSDLRSFRADEFVEALFM